MSGDFPGLVGRKPRWPGGKFLEFRPCMRLDESLFRTLDKHAKRRGLSQKAVAALILTAVLEDDIVDAVIDDGATP